MAACAKFLGRGAWPDFRPLGRSRPERQGGSDILDRASQRWAWFIPMDRTKSKVWPPELIRSGPRAKGFENFQQPTVQVAAGKTLKVDIALKIAQEVEKVQVTESNPPKSASIPRKMPARWSSRERICNALSDDPDELQSELEALAGPSAGPNGGQIYVDGFTAGQLPPKADILEIRINQNPFSAEYDKLGYGRIEITTRPGSSQFHGQVMGDLNDCGFQHAEPFRPVQNRGITRISSTPTWAVRSARRPRFSSPSFAATSAMTPIVSADSRSTPPRSLRLLSARPFPVPVP